MGYSLSSDVKLEATDDGFTDYNLGKIQDIFEFNDLNVSTLTTVLLGQYLLEDSVFKILTCIFR